MSAASRLLRRRSSELLSLLLRHSFCPRDPLASFCLVSSHLTRRFSTSGHISRNPPPTIVAGARPFLAGDSCRAAAAGIRGLANGYPGKPRFPPPSPRTNSSPEGDPSSFSLGTAIKFGVVAFTAAAVTTAVYWALEDTLFKDSKVSKKLPEGQSDNEQMQQADEARGETEKKPHGVSPEEIITEERRGDEIPVTSLVGVEEEDTPSHTCKEEEVRPEPDREVEPPLGQAGCECDATTARNPAQSFWEEREREEVEETQHLTTEEENDREECLKESIDEIFFNHKMGEQEVEENVNSTEGCPADDADAEESVSKLQQVLKEVGVEADHRDTPRITEKLSEAYHLRDVREENSNRFNKDTEMRMNEADECGRVDEEDIQMRHSSTGGDVAASDKTFREILLGIDAENKRELMELRAQQLRDAEYASQLEKDLDKERQRAETRLKQQHQSAENRLRYELERKEEETKRVLDRMELLAKAQTAATVTQEKAKRLQETRELQIQLEALRTAFNAQSEEAKASHTTHKLAMGTFAFEDAMMRGAPVEKEVELLLQSTGGHGKDELVDAALLSLPKDVLKIGTWTDAQLKEKASPVCELAGALEELALIPEGQGGFLTHLVARTASAIKVREDKGAEGVEAIITRVERCLRDGKLSEAAHILETGLQGTKAEPLAAEWVKKAQDRVVAEQALAMVQAHAVAIAAGLT